jgi:hypothetical protein
MAAIAHCTTQSMAHSKVGHTIGSSQRSSENHTWDSDDLKIEL